MLADLKGLAGTILRPFNDDIPFTFVLLFRDHLAVDHMPAWYRTALKAYPNPDEAWNRTQVVLAAIAHAYHQRRPFPGMHPLTSCASLEGRRTLLAALQQASDVRLITRATVKSGKQAAYKLISSMEGGNSCNTVSVIYPEDTRGISRSTWHIVQVQRDWKHLQL